MYNAIDHAPHLGSLGSLDDQTLLERVRKGNDAAYADLATRYWESVNRVARGMLPDGPAAEAAQATFRALLHPGDAFPRAAPFRVSLYRVLLGECWRRLRDGGTVSIVEGRLAKRVRELLHQLEALDRAGFVLRQIEELSVEETAEILGIDPVSVRQRTHRATLVLSGTLSGLPETTALAA
jgi:RNA polymerase sigma-70 factor (ECF subfamily)